MVRLAVRKTSSRTTRHNVKRRAASEASKQANKKAKRPSNHAAKKTQPSKEVYAPRIKTFLQHLETLASKRKGSNGAGDQIAKKLETIHSSLQKELQKANVINPNTAKHLKKIPTTIRGASNVPKGIRMNLQQLMKFIKEHVKNDVTKFLKTMKNTMSPLQNELKNLEMKLNKEVKEAKNKKNQIKVEPALKRRFNTLNDRFTKTKTNWFGHLNGLNRHAPKNVQTSVNQVKKQFEEIQKCAKRIQTILNRYTKSGMPKKQTETHDLLKPTSAKTTETKYKQFQQALDNFKTQIKQCYEDQLKAVKQL